MANNNLRALSKLRDSISYVYAEHAIIEQEEFSLVIIRKDGSMPVPVASTTCLLLGPGVSITHAAIKTAAENGCMIIWCGEGVQSFYAMGIGETRSAENLLHQAKLCMDPVLHHKVVQRMYLRRFGDIADETYTVQQLRGMEGVRVREAYQLASRTCGVPWRARNYKATDWDEADPINRALSCANTVLYGLCHAAIVSLGFSPALGFIHTGKQLSFVYDVADLYKADITIPAAFSAVKDGRFENLESYVRRRVRNLLSQQKLLRRIPEDLEWIFQVSTDEAEPVEHVGDLWDPSGKLQGGKNWGEKSAL